MDYQAARRRTSESRGSRIRIARLPGKLRTATVTPAQTARRADGLVMTRVERFEMLSPFQRLIDVDRDGFSHGPSSPLRLPRRRLCVCVFSRTPLRAHRHQTSLTCITLLPRTDWRRWAPEDHPRIPDVPDVRMRVPSPYPASATIPAASSLE